MKMNPCASSYALFRATSFSRTTSASASAPWDCSALDIFDNMVIAEVQPQRAIEAAARLAQNALAVRSARGDAGAVADEVLSLAGTLAVGP